MAEDLSVLLAGYYLSYQSAKKIELISMAGKKWYHPTLHVSSKDKLTGIHYTQSIMTFINIPLQVLSI